MCTIVVYPKLSEAGLRRIREEAPEVRIVQADQSQDLAADLKQAEVVVGWQGEVEKACEAEGSRIQWIQAWGAGIDRMPLELFAHKGISLTTASGVHPHPVSETALAMMLAFARNLHISIRHQAERRWENPSGMTELHGKTIGIIGVGAIGEEIARMAQAFGMKTLGIRRSGEPVGVIDQMFDGTGLDSVLAESDIVVAIMPLTDDTHHMFGREQFARMKSSAIFINVSRGATVDTEALIDALRSGDIAGAGLDVFEQEPLPAEHPLWELTNVIITPHNGGATDRYEERVLDIFLQNLADYQKGQKPSLNLVDTERQY
ncbi:D-2-hydroxyacid dehydrogenase [Paenibacillus daejeonensis]|uniref:D-2-hydroxyacid dehydrogenase n=1 Tax=Paenibacillus daejeonensis TaxID=135193 RepID=UPI00035FC99A|nr:D-2-hydroxyacid dehydrogenase [Paenibacillus daejeonensis]